jgi:hypothetical protein
VSDSINSPVISQLLKGMEIEHPRKSPVIPAWDLGIVMSSLKLAPYEPLSSAPLKELTYKTVFLLAMASGGRRSELQALMYDDIYCNFAPYGAQVKLSFNPAFIRKNQRASETNAPLIIPAIPTGKQQFGHPNCPVRALKYYHRRTRDPSIRKGRLHMFIPLKDVNQGHELSGSTISRWIAQRLLQHINLFPARLQLTSRPMKYVQLLLHYAFFPRPLSIKLLPRVVGIAVAPFRNFTFGT